MNTRCKQQIELAPGIIDTNGSGRIDLDVVERPFDAANRPDLSVGNLLIEEAIENFLAPLMALSKVLASLKLTFQTGA